MLSGGAEIAEELGFVDGIKAFHRLDFDNDAIGHQEVESMLADWAALVVEQNCDLPHKIEPAEGKLVAEGVFINALEEPGTKVSVHLNRGPLIPSEGESS